MRKFIVMRFTHTLIASLRVAGMVAELIWWERRGEATAMPLSIVVETGSTHCSGNSVQMLVEQ